MGMLLGEDPTTHAALKDEGDRSIHPPSLALMQALPLALTPPAVTQCSMDRVFTSKGDFLQGGAKEFQQV